MDLEHIQGLPVIAEAGLTALLVKNGILIWMPTITPEIIAAAILGFEKQKLRIDAEIAELHAMLPGGRTEPPAPPEAPTTKRRRMSAAARKRMSEGQTKRWAESK